MRHPTSTSRHDHGAKPHSWHLLAVMLAVPLSACTERPLGDSDAGLTSTGAATTTSTSPGSSGPTTPTTGGVVTSSGAVTSEPPPDTSTGPGDTAPGCMDGGQDTGCSCEGGCPEVKNCPGLQQLDPECPEGQKCTVDGDIGATHCVEIVPGAKGLYEPCTSTGEFLSGLDDCGLGMLCWGVDERGHGICIGMCDGNEDCVCADPEAFPSLCQSCAVGLCLPSCDPLLQDCSGDDLCIPNGDAFVCVIDASGDEGQVNDPCEFANFCDKGLYCVDSATASSACDPQVVGCCQPFCQFPGGACPNPDQACVQWSEPGAIPPGSENVGICSIPE